jgi:hypothetical protein
MDVVFLALSVAFFAAMIGLTYFFEKAREYK